MEKPNAYLGLHEMTIVEISSRFQEAEFDAVDGEEVLINPEDLFFTITLVLDNGLPYDLICPTQYLPRVAECFDK
jgi:hypothetical protein